LSFDVLRHLSFFDCVIYTHTAMYVVKYIIVWMALILCFHVYSHTWQKDMLVMWDNRSVLHAATGGYDGYDRLLHRTTISDTQF